MLRASLRISKALFPLLMGGKSFAGEFFSVKVSASPDKATSRFAFVVSKKVAKTAVMRNRLRRRGYAALRPLIPSLARGRLVGFFAKNNAVLAPTSKIALDIRAILTKSGMF